MATAWPPDQLSAIASAHELEIATFRPDGTLRPWTPIWAVAVGDQAYVRTWVRRTTGWYGHAVRAGRARIRVPGLEIDVTVEDVGDRDPALRSAVDDAYRRKYGRGDDGSASGMTTDETAATTLRLSPSASGLASMSGP